MRVALWPDESPEQLRHDVSKFFESGLPHVRAVLVALNEGQPIGFAELNIRSCAEGCETDRVAFVEGWYVEPHARRRGIGRALIACSEEWAISQGCTELASDALVENELSTAAHIASGFEEVVVIRCFRKRLPSPATSAQ